MNRATTLILFVLVLGLGAAIWFQTEREDPEAAVVQFPLFEDLDTRRVVRARWDNIERSIHIMMERDEGGRWFMVDPIAYPARPEFMVQLMEALSNVAWRVPEGDEGADYGLDPPRAVLAITELMPDGQERTHELEMGQVDLDGMRVYARTRGRVWRTGRNLETTLEHAVNEWRSRRIFDLAGDRLVQIRREGFDYRGEEQVPLRLDTQRQGASWWIDRPVRIHGDPATMTMWSRALASIRLRGFVEDRPGSDLSYYNLDAPWFSVTLIDHLDVAQTVHFAQSGGRYFAKRDDLPHVWEIEGRELMTVTQDPLELFDSAIARVFRRDVEQIDVVGSDHTVRILHDLIEDDWTVQSYDPSGEWTVAVPANTEVVERMLSVVEQEEIASYLWGESVETYFPEERERQGVWLQAGGIRYGGEIGPEHTTEAGTTVRTFLRDRETRVAVVPLSLHELLEISPLDLESPFLWALNEQQQSRLTLVFEGDEREYRRTVQSTWVYADQALNEMEAKELHPVLDHVLFLKAARHLSPEDVVELEDPIEVRIKGLDRTSHAATIGRAPDGEVRAQVGARQSVLAFPDLHELLLGIVAKE